MNFIIYFLDPKGSLVSTLLVSGLLVGITLFQIVRLEECNIGRVRLHRRVQDWKSASFQDLYLKLNRIYNFLNF